jgi:perosamine synthetase
MHQGPSVKRIPIAGPWITDKEVAYVADAARNAWYEDANTWIHRFERAFAEYVGVPHAISLPSCTSAIHLALAALGIGPGDEVIVPEATWIASSAPISYVGATPVFADIDPVTWCISPASVRACLTPRTKAVIAVDLYGGMPEMAALEALASGHGFALIEDAAEAIGSVYQNRRAGGFGAAGTFSFHGSKTLTTGEGGMLVTRSRSLYERALVLRDHGRAVGDRQFFNLEIAFKYKMSAMQAALGAAQLERIGELIERKRRIFAWYAEELAQLSGVQLNAEPEGTRNGYWMITVVLEDGFGRKERLFDYLDARRIDTRPFFHPLSSLPAYAGEPQAALARERNATAYRIGRNALNLPSALNLSRDQVHFVCEALRSYLREGQQRITDEGRPR